MSAFTLNSRQSSFHQAIESHRECLTALAEDAPRADTLFGVARELYTDFITRTSNELTGPLTTYDDSEIRSGILLKMAGFVCALLLALLCVHAVQLGAMLRHHCIALTTSHLRDTRFHNIAARGVQFGVRHCTGL